MFIRFIISEIREKCHLPGGALVHSGCTARHYLLGKVNIFAITLRYVFHCQAFPLMMAPAFPPERLLSTLPQAQHPEDSPVVMRIIKLHTPDNHDIWDIYHR